MTNRREFLQAAAVSMLPALAAAAPSVAPGQAARARAGLPAVPGIPAIPAVLLDARHPQSRAARAPLTAGAVRVHMLPDGDITHTWLQHLRPAWERAPMAVAGLTERPALFCLEQLATARGLRVVFHAEHVVHCAGATEHTLLRGAGALGLSVRDLTRAGTAWPAVIAARLAGYREPAGRARVGPSDAALDPRLPPGARLVTSWIIAAA